MREIRFRGVAKWNDVMTYGSYAEQNGKHYIISNSGKHYEVYEDTVGQSIGIKYGDRNIYEGDIIKCNNTTGIVRWNECMLSFVYEDEDGGHSFVNGQRFDERKEYRTYEIIGSIHDKVIVW